MSETVLLPCPFCGSDYVMPEVTITTTPRIYVTCKDCLADGPAFFFARQDQLPEFTRLAIDGWNIRRGEGG